MARLALLCVTSIAALAWGGAAHACDGAGVITRIEGRPQDVIITRHEGGAAMVVTRPRVLEVICRGDLIHATAPSAVVLEVDGAGAVRVDHAQDYAVPARGGAPTLAGNAYRSITDQVMPDMKRLPWNVRIKGEGDDFGFAVPAMTAGGQQLRAGSRALLVRLVGGTAPYRVELRGADGAVVASQTSASHEVALRPAALAAGAYRILASDTSRTLDAAVTVVAVAPPADEAFAGLADPEIRAALDATALARQAPATWSFEAEQVLAAAPAHGLDRDRVYELIESYSAE